MEHPSTERSSAECLQQERPKLQRSRSLPVLSLFLAVAVAAPLGFGSVAAAEDAWKAGDVEAAERYRDAERERARRYREEVARTGEKPAQAVPAPAREHRPARERRPVVVAEEPAAEKERSRSGGSVLDWPGRMVGAVVDFAAGLRDRVTEAVFARLEEGAQAFAASAIAWFEDEMFPAIAGVLRDELLPSSASEPERLGGERELQRAQRERPADESELRWKRWQERESRHAEAETEPEPQDVAPEWAPRQPEKRRRVRSKPMLLINRFAASGERESATRIGSAELAVDWHQAGNAIAEHAVRWWEDEAMGGSSRPMERDAR